MDDAPWTPTIHPAATATEMTQIVLPTHANNHGTAFGGQIAAWCDICAAVAAQRTCHGLVVTASMDALHFLTPIKSGQVVVLRAQLNQTWSSSMEIGVRVEAEDPRTGARTHCCSAYLSFVALGEEGGTRRVPALYTGGDPTLERRAREAEERRAHRLAVRAQRQAALAAERGGRPA
jgi:acyl-CoA hydrolase